MSLYRLEQEVIDLGFDIQSKEVAQKLAFGLEIDMTDIEDDGYLDVTTVLSHAIAGKIEPKRILHAIQCLVLSSFKQ